ncbi:MAG: hypothetical protein U1B83_02465, partial [Candidatus Cloacimonadaceae bacterium]|nr:hypothetical protein [Candidatus Cloacimonadaceae bacterium]
MRKILFVSYYFPPLGGVAAIRGLKYVKHLSALGYQVIVLSVQSEYLRYPQDPDLLKELPEGLSVHRAFCPD